MRRNDYYLVTAISGMVSMEQVIGKLKALPGFHKVRFIILHGSQVHGGAGGDSDIDLCIGYDGDREEASGFRFRALSALRGDRYDIQIFQQLPLYIRVRVLKGRVVYAPDERFLYDIAYATIRDFADFAQRYYDYIGERAIT